MVFDKKIGNVVFRSDGLLDEIFKTIKTDYPQLAGKYFHSISGLYNLISQRPAVFRGVLRAAHLTEDGITFPPETATENIPIEPFPKPKMRPPVKIELVKEPEKPGAPEMKGSAGTKPEHPKNTGAKNAEPKSGPQKNTGAKRNAPSGTESKSTAQSPDFENLVKRYFEVGSDLAITKTEIMGRYHGQIPNPDDKRTVRFFEQRGWKPPARNDPELIRYQQLAEFEVQLALKIAEKCPDKSLFPRERPLVRGRQIAVRSLLEINARAKKPKPPKRSRNRFPGPRRI